MYDCQMALMHDDIKQADFATRPYFENTTCKFNHGKIPKAAKMKRIPL